MRLISFKQLPNNNGGALVGFANVELPNGLKINDCPVLISNGKPWAALPAKPQIGLDGRQIEINSKKQYTSILAWPNRETAGRLLSSIWYASGIPTRWESVDDHHARRPR